MGLDLLIAATAIEEGRVPDWACAEQAIARLPPSALDDFVERRSLGELSAQLVADLREFRDAFAEPVRRDASTITVRGLVVYIAGGLSEGDPPSELYAAMRRLLRAGVLEPAGFGAE